MITDMASSTDRMRLKDKIIANIAKAIKGIQEAVFYRSKARAENGPLIMSNNDRQCHKLCENLDHVFLHGLRHVTHGYWKVIAEFTHKNIVKEIDRIQNITTDLGRGRAWIFVALNECLLESYIRCMLGNVKFLKKHYVKEALVLDQQQMTVLLTLTAGLDCVVFKLEYDLPYLDLFAYPPRTRTASEMEEEEADHISLKSMGSLPSQQNNETRVSTPESARAQTDSDTASLSSLDTATSRHISARISSVSADSGFPGDALSPQSSKQRSVTPIDTLSISSHGSTGELDRLTRLENIITVADNINEREAELEVIRLKGNKKSNKKKKKVTRKSTNGAISPELPTSVPFDHLISGTGDGDDSVFQNTGNIPEKMDSSSDKKHLHSVSNEGSSPLFNPSSVLTQTKLERGELINCDPCLNIDFVNHNSLIRNTGKLSRNEASLKSEGTADSSSKKDLHDFHISEFPCSQGTTNIVNEMIPSVVSQAHEKQQPQLQNDHKCPHVVPTSQKKHSVLCSEAHGCGLQFGVSHTTAGNTNSCDEHKSQSLQLELGSDNSISGIGDEQKDRSALAELELKCEALCKPLNETSDRSLSLSIFTQSNAVVQSVDQNADSKHVITETSPISSNVQRLQARERLEQEDFDDLDFYANSNHVGGKNPHRAHLQMEDYVDYVSGRHVEHTSLSIQDTTPTSVKIVSEAKIKAKVPHEEYALRLDNNKKLQIMLEIFTQHDEEFLKLFVTREGHTEGEMKTVFLLVTSHCMYLLQQKGVDHKFVSDISILLKDLSFISLSLNKQILHIESSGPGRRKERIWLTPGDSFLTQEILDCLEGAVKSVMEPTMLTSHFSIGSDEPLQTISLRKYIARDCHCEEQEVYIADYSLVFWEDTQTSIKKNNSLTSREGMLLLRVNDAFMGHIWKPVYVVLRDCMLCIFANKLDNKPQQYVCLGGEQCIGCRLETSMDRKYCIEIILSKGVSWYLSAASETEISRWRQCLCMAVSEGLQNTLLSCLPCVSVVTHQKLLLCHEDIQTKFCRTIASARVEEVTALTLDPEFNTYCVVEFESQERGVSSEQWVLYFNSAFELDRFITGLCNVWKEIYQVDLIPSTLEDLPLQKRCQDQATLLKHSLTMK